MAGNGKTKNPFLFIIIPPKILDFQERRKAIASRCPITGGFSRVLSGPDRPSLYIVLRGLSFGDRPFPRSSARSPEIAPVVDRASKNGQTSRSIGGKLPDTFTPKIYAGTETRDQKADPSHPLFLPKFRLHPPDSQTLCPRIFDRCQRGLESLTRRGDRGENGRHPRRGTQVRSPRRTAALPCRPVPNLRIHRYRVGDFFNRGIYRGLPGNESVTGGALPLLANRKVLSHPRDYPSRGGCLFPTQSLARDRSVFRHGKFKAIFPLSPPKLAFRPPAITARSSSRIPGIISLRL